jgi:hypothetical protein
LHNLGSGMGSKQQQLPLPSGSSSVLAGRSHLGVGVTGAGTACSGVSTAAAAGSSRGGLPVTAAAAGGDSSPAAAWQLSGSPLVPAAGGNSPLTLQQRRQQQQQRSAGRAAADAEPWGHTRTVSRLDQQQQQQQQQQASRISPARQLGRQQQQQGPVLGTVDGRYDAGSSWATQGGDTGRSGLSPAAEKSDWLLDRLDRNLREVQRTAGDSAAGRSGSSNSSRSSGQAAAGGAGDNSSSGSSTPAGASLVALGNDVMGALSLSQYHRERSKQQEARAKQHAQNAQDALDRAAAVRSSRLSSASPQPAVGAAAAAAAASAANVGGRSLSPRLAPFGSR